jgi:hypothetical protein
MHNKSFSASPEASLTLATFRAAGGQLQIHARVFTVNLLFSGHALEPLILFIIGGKF